MPEKIFTLTATVSSDDPAAIEPVLKKLIGGRGIITPVNDGFQISGKFSGESAKELNRQLLSEMRRVEKRTRLRAAWTSDDTVERFFDYVPKGVRRAK
jgi:hypothetical protein